MTKPFAYFIFCLGLFLGLFLVSQNILAYSFVDEFSADTRSNIWIGDQRTPKDRISGTGNGNWNVWYQNWYNTNNPYPDDDYRTVASCTECPGGCTCSVPQCFCCDSPCCKNPCTANSYNQCPEYYGTNPGNARVLIQGGILDMYRDGNNNGSVLDCDDRAHRFMYVQSKISYITTPNFQLEMRYRLADPGTGWGILWSVPGIFTAHFIRVQEQTLLTFDGIGSYWLPGYDANWHTILVKSTEGTREAWVSENVKCVSASDNRCESGAGGVSCSSCYVGGGTGASTPSGYINFGHTASQCMGWQEGVCSYNNGMGNWPRFQVDYIRINLGPENGPTSVLQPPQQTCVGPATGVVRFQSTTTDADGYNNLQYVGFIINTNPDGNTAAGAGNPAGAFSGRYAVSSSTDAQGSYIANHFYLAQDDGVTWMDLGAVGSLTSKSNSYVTLLNSSSVSGSGNTLAVYWDLQFKNTWTESAKLWLYSEDITNLFDGWDDEGNFSIDGTPPNVPNLPSAVCAGQTSLTWSWNAVSDTGCGGTNNYYLRGWDNLGTEATGPYYVNEWVGNVTSKQVSSIPAGRIVYAKVKAKDSLDNESAFSATSSKSISDCNAGPTCTASVSPTSGTTQAGFLFSFILKASDPDNDNLSYLWNFGDGATSNGQILPPLYATSTTSHQYTTAGTYTGQATVNDGKGGITNCSTPPITVQDPTLYVDLEANPYYGLQPLNVSLKANVSGTMTGPITYKFDCTNNGDWEHTITTNQNPYTFSFCTYNATGTHTAKVDIERGDCLTRGICPSDTTKIFVGQFCDTSGWAWSDNIGWISFNGSNYGVKFISSSGDFFGYAWSDNIGWIDFAPAGPYPFSPYYTARLDLDTNKVTGWARAVSYDDSWDGWIKMANSNYGVTRSGCNLEGWAWGSDVIGWISFNGSNYGVNISLLSCCENKSPYINSQGIKYQTYCNDVFPGTGQIGFKWVYKDDDGDSELRFDFRVNNINDVNDPNPEVDRSYSNLNNPGGTTNNQAVLVVTSPETDKLLYGTTYYWWVRVWDSRGANSGWVAGSSFSTPAHAYPWPNFAPSPQNPSAGEIVSFIDSSQCYSSQYNCKDGALINYAWDFDYITPDFTVDSTYKGNATTTYSESKTYKVQLRITDNTLSPPGICFSGEKSVGATLPLPTWKEIAPF